MAPITTSRVTPRWSVRSAAGTASRPPEGLSGAGGCWICKKTETAAGFGPDHNGASLVEQNRLCLVVSAHTLHLR